MKADAAIVVKTRLSESDWQRLRAKADQEGRSIASHVAWLIRRDLDEKAK